MEFIALDAGRSEPEVLKAMVDAAVGAGAGTVTVCDTAGALLPEEFFASVKRARADLPTGVRLGVWVSNDLALADGEGETYGNTDRNGNGLVDTGNVLEHRQPEKVKFFKVKDQFLIEIPERTEYVQQIDLEELFR